MLKTRFKTALIISIFLITAFSMLMCGCERKHGEFYTLEEAYNSGLLTKENLEEIAYYVNNSMRYPEALDGKIEKKIKNDMAYEIRHVEKAAVKNAKPDGFEVKKYYGEYNGNYVVLMESIYYDNLTVITEITVEGITFVFSTSNTASVWTEKI